METEGILPIANHVNLINPFRTPKKHESKRQLQYLSFFFAEDKEYVPS